MKTLRITVEGRVYEVTVQVLEDDEATVTGAGYVTPPVAAPRATAPMTAAAAAAAVARPAGMPRAQPNAILAPIAGTVQKVFVDVGSELAANAPVVLLDAMKMDTYIYAPRALSVTEVAVKAGDAVQVGDPLIRFSPRE